MRYPVTETGSKSDFEKDWYIAQGFANPTTYGFHEGVDINLKTGGDTDLGQEVRAIADGKIVYYHFTSHPTTGFGRHLVYEINGPWGTRWVHCCHLSNLDFKNSVQNVTEGQIIGRIGKSGTIYAHLHFSILKINPANIDNVANSAAELYQHWEDPLAFMDTWIAATPVTDQSLYDFGEGFGVLELQAARSILQAQKTELVDLKQRLITAADDLRELADQLEG